MRCYISVRWSLFLNVPEVPRRHKYYIGDVPDELAHDFLIQLMHVFDERKKDSSQPKARVLFMGWGGSRVNLEITNAAWKILNKGFFTAAADAYHLAKAKAHKKSRANADK
jgi:hypothetical protein